MGSMYKNWTKVQNNEKFLGMYQFDTVTRPLKFSFFRQIFLEYKPGAGPDSALLSI